MIFDNDTILAGGGKTGGKNHASNENNGRGTAAGRGGNI